MSIPTKTYTTIVVSKICGGHIIWYLIFTFCINLILNFSISFSFNFNFNFSNESHKAS